ncbi:hypothetical protein AYI68_g3303 [Smittium mucronatum]|uniref:Uncharacterized protein n=1 Tax=Smittium mucronatum TaxID=133383 RepID=A0A1R0H0B3_9FUNG|nr:hypothetical protein AYI68_g3303 [Smittium mucronatum]
MRKREPQLDEEDPFATPRIPFTEIPVYKELSEAFPSIEEDFFRTPLSEDDRKNALYTCTKTSSMSYVPPLLNDSASTAYVYRKIQDNPGVIVADDPDIVFSNTMRVLLSEIATAVTQNILDNLHKGMKFPGRIKQIVLNEIKLLMNQNAFDAFLASKKKEMRKRRDQLFCKRHQVAVSCEASGSNVAMSQTAAASTTIAPSIHPQLNHQNFWGRGHGRGSHPKHSPPVKSSEFLGKRPRKRVSVETQSGPPVGECLAIFWSVWTKLTGSQWVWDIVVKGFQTPLRDLKPSTTDSNDSLTSLFVVQGRLDGLRPSKRPSTTKGPNRLNEEDGTAPQTTFSGGGAKLTIHLRRHMIKMDPAAHAVLKDEVASLLAKKTIEEVNTRDPGFYSDLFVIPKKTGGLRPGSSQRGQEIIEHRENRIDMSIELRRESSGDFSCSSSETSNSQEVIRIEEPITVESEVLEVDNTYPGIDAYQHQEAIDSIICAPAPEFCWKKLPKLQLGNMGQSLHMSSMESNPTNNSEGAPETSTNYTGNSTMEDSDLVPRPAETIVQSTFVTTSDNGNTRHKKRKIADVEEQSLAPDGMEN